MEDLIEQKTEQDEQDLETLKGMTCPKCGTLMKVSTEIGLDHKVREVANCPGCGYSEMQN